MASVERSNYNSIGSFVRRLVTPALVILAVAYLWSNGLPFYYRPHCPSYGGFVHPDFEEVKQVFKDSILSGFEQGGTFSVYYKGQALVDLWGGCADERASKAWTRDTLTQAWSVTKAVAAICLGRLVDRGRLDPSKTVAHYWPEFAQNGKEEITVAMLLSHQAGLSNLQRTISLHEYRDNWTVVADMMAQQKPVWTPGTRYNYHALTVGMYADALVRKVDEKNRNITQFFKEEIAVPLDLDFHIGLPREQFHRSTRATYDPYWKLLLKFLLDPDNWPFIPAAIRYSDILYDSFHAVDFIDKIEVMNDAELRLIGLASCNGFGTARSLAKLFDYVANNGTIKGTSIVSQEAVSILATPFTKDIPVIIAPKSPYSPLGTNLLPSRHGQSVVGHTGNGGQRAFADLQHHIGVAYLTNYNDGSGDAEDPRLGKLLDALYPCLKKFQLQSQ